MDKFMRVEKHLKIIETVSDYYWPKGKTVELVIGFSKLDFHHLMGLEN